MKIPALLLVVVATATNVDAIFAPRSRAPVTTNKHAFSYSQLKSLPSSFGNVDTVLAVSGGASSKDDSSGLFQSLIDTDILVIDTEIAATEAAEHWGLILVSGTFSVAAGCLALYNPFEATDVAFLSTFLTLAVAGFINTTGFLFAERGFKILTLVVGLSQLALGAVMNYNPFESELGLSLCVTMSVFADGLYRVMLAVQNPDLPGRWATLLAGLVGAATSVYVTKFMPLTFVAAPGIALGTSLVATGIARISVGFAGRDVAKDAKGK